METPRIHPFEVAGLGKAPFKCVGYEYRTFQACQGAPVQVGGSCRYCGQGICHTYLIKSSDGKIFPVGSNCVEKTNSKGAKILTEIQQAKKEHDRQVKREKETESRNLLREKLDRPEVINKLSALPHPVEFMAKNGKTYLDYAVWSINVAGLALLTTILKKIEE